MPSAPVHLQRPGAYSDAGILHWSQPAGAWSLLQLNVTVAGTNAAAAWTRRNTTASVASFNIRNGPSLPNACLPLPNTQRDGPNLQRVFGRHRQGV